MSSFWALFLTQPTTISKASSQVCLMLWRTFMEVTSLTCRVTTPFTYDVENVALIQHSFKRPCEDSSTKRVLNFTQSTVTTRVENGL